MRGRAVALVVLLAPTVLAAGCGSSAPTPGEIAQNYVNALAQGNYASACAQLGRRAEATLVRRYGARVPCRAVLAHCLPNQAAVAKRDQTQLLFATVVTRISGRHAYVQLSGTAVARRIKQVTLTRRHGSWQLTSYGRGLSSCRAGAARARHHHGA